MQASSDLTRACQNLTLCYHLQNARRHRKKWFVFTNRRQQSRTQATISNSRTNSRQVPDKPTCNMTFALIAGYVTTVATVFDRAPITNAIAAVSAGAGSSSLRVQASPFAAFDSIAAVLLASYSLVSTARTAFLSCSKTVYCRKGRDTHNREHQADKLPFVCSREDHRTC